MAAETKDVSQTNQSIRTVQIGDFKTITLPKVKVDETSTNPDDFVELLNIASPLLGGITNLGVFCDITSVSHKSALLADVEMQYIHVETEDDEQPDRKLVNDGSSTNPSDLSYETLLDDSYE